MSVLEADLYVSYSQIAVFDAALESPFNDWTEEQVLEGVSTSDRSVSFKTPIEDGDATVHIDIGAENAQGLSRIIAITGGKGIEIATITDAFPIEIENGRYEVEYSGRHAEDGCVCNITIRKVD